MFGNDSTSAPIFNWIREKSGLIRSRAARRGGLDEEKQVMRSFQNILINISYCCTVETSRISLAWSIMGGSEGLCVRAYGFIWGNIRLKRLMSTPEQIRDVSGGDGAVEGSFKCSRSTLRKLFQMITTNMAAPTWRWTELMEAMFDELRQQHAKRNF